MKLIQKQERVNGSVKNAPRPSGAISCCINTKLRFIRIELLRRSFLTSLSDGNILPKIKVTYEYFNSLLTDDLLSYENRPF
jgi:hypothetical protein